MFIPYTYINIYASGFNHIKMNIPINFATKNVLFFAQRGVGCATFDTFFAKKFA